MTTRLPLEHGIPLEAELLPAQNHVEAIQLFPVPFHAIHYTPSSEWVLGSHTDLQALPHRRKAHRSLTVSLLDGLATY